jgi:hypothetical protein
MSTFDPKRTSGDETIPSSHLIGSGMVPTRRWRHCKTIASRAAGWLSATPDASTCSRSFMTCRCHFAPRCQMRQSNIGSVKRDFRWQAGASVSCRTYRPQVTLRGQEANILVDATAMQPCERQFHANALQKVGSCEAKPAEL